MDYATATQNGSHIFIHNVKNFDLDTILNSGQCFRWQKLCPGKWSGVAFGRELTILQEESCLTLYNTSLSDFEALWRNYFDLGRDYGKLKKLLLSDEAMAKAVAFCPGMRVLRQEPWEALCSFIISQNNNIPRIKGIIQRLCAAFGAPLPQGGFSFPAAQALAGLSVEDLAEIRSGFRAKYILDAAKWVASGKLILPQLAELGLEEARQALLQIKGVGKKVAECALLYGCGRIECMPVDVWISRALSSLYPNGFPAEFAPVAGLAQQYLFHYMRHGKPSQPVAAS